MYVSWQTQRGYQGRKIVQNTSQWEKEGGHEFFYDCQTIYVSCYVSNVSRILVNARIHSATNAFSIGFGVPNTILPHNMCRVPFGFYISWWCAGVLVTLVTATFVFYNLLING